LYVRRTPLFITNPVNYCTGAHGKYISLKLDHSHLQSCVEITVLVIKKKFWIKTVDIPGVQNALFFIIGL